MGIAAGAGGLCLIGVCVCIHGVEAESIGKQARRDVRIHDTDDGRTGAAGRRGEEESQSVETLGRGSKRLMKEQRPTDHMSGAPLRSFVRPIRLDSVCSYRRRWAVARSAALGVLCSLAFQNSKTPRAHHLPQAPCRPPPGLWDRSCDPKYALHSQSLQSTQNRWLTASNRISFDRAHLGESHTQRTVSIISKITPCSSFPRCSPPPLP